MVRSSTHKTKIGFLAALVASTPMFLLSSAQAANPESLTFQVNVEEALSIAITNPATWASGDLIYNSTTGKYESDFLRNKVNVSATTNNGAGVTVSMYTDPEHDTDTTLHNKTSYSSSDSSTYIETLTSGIKSSTFRTNNDYVNRWGYSLNDTTSGSNDADYGGLKTVGHPIVVLNTTGTGVGQQDVYFGARANNERQSGTYAQTVYFAAVTGSIDSDNPAQPSINPSTPNPDDQIAHYSSNAGTGTPAGQTTYTTHTTSGSGTSPVTGATSTTTSDVTKGNTTSTYAQAAGVTSSTSDNSSALATALAASAAITAVSGTAFLLAAKRKKDDDEDEGQQNS